MGDHLDNRVLLAPLRLDEIDMRRVAATLVGFHII
jgi:hypothetical protein